MEKRYYKFDDIVNIATGNSYKNFTKTKKIPDSILSDNSLFVTVELNDNEKLEYISLMYYDTMNYWDILLMLNNVTDVYALPKDMDSLINAIEDELLKHVTYFRIANTDENEDYIRSVRADIEERLTNANEKHRSFKIVKPTKITEFLSKLDDYSLLVSKGEL